MNKKKEEALFEKLLARNSPPPVALLEDPGLWATVFSDGFRPPEGEDEDDVDSEYQDEMRERFFGDASPPDGLEGKPLFSFALPGGWQWHVVFHGSERGGHSHAISRGERIEAVAQNDGHPEQWSALSFSQVRLVSTVVLDSGPVPSRYLAPLLYPVAVPAPEGDRRELETWMAAAVERAGILPRKAAKELASSLLLTSSDAGKPEQTATFKKFLEEIKTVG